MKNICITGGIDHDLKFVADLLQQSGMMPPTPAHDNLYRDMSFWHQQVIASANEDADTFQDISNPGRMWEQLASEIFLDNIDSKIWGWAETQSTWLLDFWSSFEPRLSFVLVCCAPEQMLAHIISTGKD
ncbi:MAG: hypothetical protein PHH11_12990, partial [Methylomonas sp.]|nr:hypothetical protein [Methylomonas sp.]